jgi:hypothetical protein
MQNRKLKVEFYFTSPATDTFSVSVYKGTTRVPLTTDSAGATNLPKSTTGKFTAYFDTDSSGTWTLSITRTAGSGATPLQFTNVVVGPGIQPQGAVVGEWQSTTLTPSVAAFGTVSNQDYWIKREGSEAIIRGSFLTGTTAASPAVIAMPANLTINATALASTARGRLGRFEIGTTIGNALISSTDKEGVIYYNGSSTSNLYLTVQTTTTGYYANNGTSITGGPAYIIFEARVPIAEWTGSGTVQLAQNDVEYAYNTSGLTTAGGSNTSAFGYGPVGAVLGSIASTTQATSYTTMRVRFQTPIQAGDSIVVEFDGGQNQWMPAPNRSPWIINNAAVYGVQAVPVFGSLTDVDVLFGNSGQQSSGALTYGTSGSAWSNISTWKWRVRKSSAGAAVGYGIVAKDQSGLLPAYNTNLDDATATRLGLKQYLHGTSYNGGNAPTVTSSQAGFSVNRAVFVPYQTQDGAWRLKFNITAAFTSATITSNVTTIAGTVFKSTTNNYQPAFGMPIGNTLGIYQAYVSPSTGALTLITPSTPGVTGVAYSGDVELDSKPTWAYS